MVVGIRGGQGALRVEMQVIFILDYWIDPKI
jgi:hypothetical protein